MPVKDIKQTNADYTALWITNLMNITDSEKFSAIKGNLVRVKVEDDTVLSIGHIFKDKWFNLENTTTRNK